ncbi:hypothetical protein J4E90_007411 [Alternaria incomplexa]|uniref:uncharacterized protein n=1 Tax=Alternaria incomplexa TaxID=1187928 RepID=UPI00221E53F6|nr:uncharacterized protein J4E90_007411 [Alternaria incomplexa]KAI4911153.1 hypothetical protein J4E90_007411 [Alternaria incomplexa]
MTNQGTHKRPANDKTNYHPTPGEVVTKFTAYAGYVNLPDDTPLEPTENDPYHVPAYFDLSEAPTSTPEEVKLEFNPPLVHYAELRGGLPIGYVWIPPSSPEPMPREVTSEQDVAFTTPLRPARSMGTSQKRKKTVTFDLSTQKKRKRDTTAEFQARFTSPLSEDLSDAPDGLLTPEPREFVLRRR